MGAERGVVAVRRLNIWVLGGDLRQVKLAEALAEDEHSVHLFALGDERAAGAREERSLDGIGLADCVVLPLPVADGENLNAPLDRDRHALRRVLSALRPEQVVCGGLVEPHVRAMAEDCGITIRDYLDREELAVLNAVPTAEGAIQLAMEELPITLWGSRALVVGFGRLGRVLAPRLSALGARVTVSARKYADLAWAESFGYGTEHTGALAGWLCGYDVIFNTVPRPVLGRAELADLKPGCLVVDLASRPGGVDLGAAGELGVKVLWALSLPGRVAPVTAGRAVKLAVYHIILEWEEQHG